MIEKYNGALMDPEDIRFPIPDDNALDMVQQYSDALPDTSDIAFPVPDDSDLERLREYQKLTSEE